MGDSGPEPPPLAGDGPPWRVWLSKPVLTRLAALAHEERTALQTVLVAAFQALLHRYGDHGGEGDGPEPGLSLQVELTASAGSAVACFRLDRPAAADPSFRALLRQVREAGNLSGGWDAVRCVLENSPETAWLLPGLCLQPGRPGAPAVSPLLTLSVTSGHEGVLADLEVSPGLIRAETLGRVAGHYQVLLEGIAADPERPVSRLPLLTGAERHQLLVEWN
jgi:hypothetical protein